MEDDHFLIDWTEFGEVQKALLEDLKSSGGWRMVGRV